MATFEPKIRNIGNFAYNSSNLSYYRFFLNIFRPSTPIRDLDFLLGGDEEVRYYIDEESSSDGLTDPDQGSDNSTGEGRDSCDLISNNMGNGVANCTSRSNQVSLFWDLPSRSVITVRSGPR